jgi:Ca2+-binding EF-hand superfamily protein
MAATIDATLRAPLEWVFDNALDEDASGFIEQREANMVAKYLGYGKSDGATSITQVWQQMLEQMDTDGDKQISREEFVVFMANKYVGRAELAIDLKNEVQLKKNQQEALKAVYNRADDLDDLEEVALDGSAAAAAIDVPASAPAAKGPVLSDAKRKQLEAKFKGMDEDGNGMLSKSEIAEVMLVDETDPTLEAIWAKADADGDGKVTFEEFVAVADAIDEALDMGDLPGL